jgi:hypothetical protein
MAYLIWLMSLTHSCSESSALVAAHPELSDPLRSMGKAYRTSSGRLAAGQKRRVIYHAITIGYDSADKKYPNSPSVLAGAFTAALQLASAEGCRSAAAQIMCARAGYSIVPHESASRVNLYVLLRCIEQLPPDSSLERVTIYVQQDFQHLLLEASTVFLGLPLEQSRSLIWLDTGRGRRGSLLDKLQSDPAQRFSRMLFTLLSSSSTPSSLLPELHDFAVIIAPLSWNGGQEGLTLAQEVRRIYPGKIILLVSAREPSQEQLLQALHVGATYLTHDTWNLEKLLAAQA